jgi:hypothetical protein
MTRTHRVSDTVRKAALVRLEDMNTTDELRVRDCFEAIVEQESEALAAMHLANAASGQGPLVSFDPPLRRIEGGRPGRLPRNGLEARMFAANQRLDSRTGRFWGLCFDTSKDRWRLLGRTNRCEMDRLVEEQPRTDVLDYVWTCVVYP